MSGGGEGGGRRREGQVILGAAAVTARAGSDQTVQCIMSLFYSSQH